MRILRRYIMVLGCTGLSLAVGAASANSSFEQATQQLCDHIKQCTLQTMDAENIDPNMRQMVEGMVKGMCKKMNQRFDLTGHDEIKSSAAACMRSMAEQECDALNNQATTPACREYEEMAKNYNPRGN